MKTLFYFLSLTLALFFFGCDDEQFTPNTAGFTFVNAGFHFDNAILTPTSTNPDGTFKTDLYLLQSHATLDASGLSGLPADAAVFTFLSLPERAELPDGEYTIGLGRDGGDVLNGYIKEGLEVSFNDLLFITSGTLTVGTSGTDRTFNLDVRIVSELTDQYDASVEGLPLSGEVTVPLEVFE